MDRQILQALKDSGAAAAGCVPYSKLVPLMSPAQTSKMARLLPEAISVVCAAFPYFTGRHPGNIAKYARGADYHIVIKDILSNISQIFHNILEPCVVLVDDSPLPEVAAARLSGVAATGCNGLGGCPGFGSYVVLGCIATAAELESGADAGFCEGCKSCAEACPTGALAHDGERVHFRRELCISRLNQRLRKPTADELALLAKSHSIWGCDICQDVCPRNAGVKHTSIPRFRENLISSLSREDIEGISDEEFLQRYGGYAFAWRGRRTILNNILRNP